MAAFLVTGATGYVGRAVATQLVNSGHAVTALARREARVAGVETRVCAEFSADSLARVLGTQSFDCVIHCAGGGVKPDRRGIEELVDSNIVATANLMMALARRTAALVVAGSCSEYGPPADGAPLRETAAVNAGDPYGATKYAAGRVALSMGRALGVPVAVARLFNLYGPHEAPHRLTSSLLDALRSNQRVPLTDGRQLRDFVFIDDAVEGMMRLGVALQSGRIKAGVYNICTGRPTSVAEFAMKLAMEAGAGPELLSFGAIQRRAGEIESVVGSPLKTAKALDWVPPTSLEEGIALTVSDAEIPKMVYA